MKQLILSFFLFTIGHSMYSQAPVILWENSIGGSTDDYGYFIRATADGGFITIGASTSADGDMSSNFGNNDVLLTKLDANGTVVWIKNLGGTNSDEGYSIHQTIDGGYYITGYTSSNDGQVATNHGQKDVWVVKTNALGVIQWENTYGGTNDERTYYSTQTTDGGYIIAGYTESSNGDVTFNNGNADVWIVKTDSAGTLLWQKSLGGSGYDYGYHVSETPDGGYIVSANTDSNDGDVSGYHGGGSDTWIIKINSTGTIQWQKCYGGSSLEYTTAAYATSEGGYIFLAYTFSSDGDITTTHGNFETWLVKTNAVGTIQWQKCLGGNDSDANYSLQKTLDGKYIIAGYTYSSDGDVSGYHGGGEADYWIVKTDTTGTIEWQTCLGGTGDDQAFYIQQLADSSYVITGLSASTDGDVTGNAGLYDCWVLKLGDAPIVTNINTTAMQTSQYPVSVFPNPNKGTFRFQHLQNNSQIEIVDVTGRTILTKKIMNASEEIQLTGIETGMYFFKVTNGSKQSTGKIVVD